MLAALCCGLTFVFTACEQNEEFEEPAKEVVFSAATSYENLPETKTEYSGEDFNLVGQTQGTERIDWDTFTDTIRVLNTNTLTAANYKITQITDGTTVRSVANVAATGDKLTWSTDNQANTFYAVYPYTAMNSGPYTPSNIGTVIGASIPATQDQDETHEGKNKNTNPATTVTITNPTMSKYAFMVAKVENAANGSNVTLPFVPAFTAFEFCVGSANDGGTNTTISKVELTSTSTALTGAWTWNGSEFTCPTFSSGTNDKITVTYSPAKTFQNSDPLRFTIFALPQNLNNVSITFHTTQHGDKTLTFTGKTFIGGKKYRITTPGLPTNGRWVYDIKEIDDITTYGHAAASLGVNVTSYRYREEDPTVEEAVTWKAQYWDGSDWQDWTAAQGDFSLLNSAYTGNGVSNSSNSESRSVELVANVNKETVQKTSIEILQEATPVTNYDLSLHDVFGNDHTQTTANTYVISAPGTYRFPCVYGNAITNGSTNYESFAPGRSPSSIVSLYTTYVSEKWDWANNNTIPIYQYPDVNYNRYFRNAINKEITQPYIIEDINSRNGFSVSGENVAIVWQDEQIVVDSDFSLITEDGHKYIQFSISASNIKPGNIVVALRGAAGGDYTDTKTILWSWQLWVTDRDLTPISGIMPANLGWNKVYNGSQKYTDRVLPIRLIQIAPADDPNGAIDNEPFTVTQIGDSEHIAENVGTNPYYQWGRKDPMIPGIYGGSNIVNEPCQDKTIYPGDDYQGMSSNATLISTSHVASDANGLIEPDYGTAIRNPHIVYIAGQHSHYGTTSWISGYVPTWQDVTGDHGKSGGSFQGERVYTAIPYNLWNSYCIGYGIPGTDWSSSTKFKTVYDPCPPGFTVPHRGLEDILGSGTDAPDHSGKYFSVQGGAVQFLPYSGARIFYNTSGVIPGTNVTVSTAGIYLRHVAGSSNEYGLYWTDCPTQFKRKATWSNLDTFDLANYEGHFFSQMYMFERSTSSEDTMDYTKGTAGAIRPMVDPRYDASSPSPSPSPSSAAPNGSINQIGTSSTQIPWAN